MKIFILSFALLIGSSITTNAQNIRLTLDNISTDISCNDIWIEEGINLSLESTTTEDCSTGDCFFGIETTYLWLFPSRLSIDLSSVQSIERVEIDIIDACGPDCTLAFLVNLDENLDIELMRKGAALFQGQHYFHKYCTKPSEKTIFKRTIASCELVENHLLKANFFPKHSYILIVEGKGFLRYQIRLMMAALFELGKGACSLSDIENSLKEDNDRHYLRNIAPASGLQLYDIDFK